MKEYRIHPAIGAARVGNADRGTTEGDGWFIGPETPGLPANYDPASSVFRPFKKDSKVKAQAARFRIWEYQEQNGQLVPVREVNLDSPEIVRIEWTVTLANRKAAFFNFAGQNGAGDLFASLPGVDLRNAKVTDTQEREALLAITPGAKSVQGRNAAMEEFLNDKAHIGKIKTLGELRTDEAGRLLVFGGRGDSGYSEQVPGWEADIGDYANNNGWFDDIADGPVTARVVVRLPNDSEQTFDAVHGAWVLVGRPDFAPPIGNVVTLYDTLWDAAMQAGTPQNPAIPMPANHALYTEYSPGRGLAALRAMRERMANYQPSFTRDIYPIFERGFQTRWVHQPLNIPDSGTLPHSRISPQQWADLAQLPGNAQVRNVIFGRMRAPDVANKPNLMPRAWGDTYRGGSSPHLTLTRTQFTLLGKWRAGQFLADWGGEPPIPAAPDISPEGLDRASLEACVGGAFYPGIEAGWLIRQRAVFVEPFRIRHDAVLSANPVFGELKIGAGFFSQQMAVPWQADFTACARENAGDIVFSWWPGQRPDDVFIENGTPEMVEWARGIASYEDMVDHWSTRGFVVRHAGRYVEREGPP